MKMTKIALCAILAFLAVPLWSVGLAQTPVRYLVRVEEPASHLYEVEAELPANGETTLVSLPAWTPGHYTLENYARYVRDFEAFDDGGRPLDWDKTDQDTWRIRSTGTGQVLVRFRYQADTLGLSLSGLREDFGFFNGTNLFVYPEGTDFRFPAVLGFDLPSGWRVATELSEGEEPGTYRAESYHELVDNPTFLGDFAMDSVQADGIWIRLVVYPGEFLQDPARRMALNALQRMAQTLHALFDGPPYDRYTTFVFLATEPVPFFGGLEHAESHFDLLPAVAFQQPAFTFRSIVYRLLSHEYYHAWNVKRIRPAELWPYDYEEEQFTPLLWVAEGVTDYYAHLVLVRAGLWNADEFWDAMSTAIGQVESQPTVVAVEDASVSTWIEPIDISQNYYYDKGALLGLFLDIRLRHATDNAVSLDSVMARLYRDHYQQGRGFTTEELLGYLAEHLGAEAVRGFHESYVDGREPMPYQESFALAGMSYVADTIVEPFFGVATAPQRNNQVAVAQVVPGSAADQAGLRVGDILERLGSVEIEGQNWGARFREVYADSAGAEIEVAWRRGEEQQTARTTIRTRTRYEHHLEEMPNATPKQEAVRRGLLGGGR